MTNDERQRLVEMAIASMDAALAALDKASHSLREAGQPTSAEGVTEARELIEYERGVQIAVLAHYVRGE